MIYLYDDINVPPKGECVLLPEGGELVRKRYCIVVDDRMPVRHFLRAVRTWMQVQLQEGGTEVG